MQFHHQGREEPEGHEAVFFVSFGIFATLVNNWNRAARTELMTSRADLENW